MTFSMITVLELSSLLSGTKLTLCMVSDLETALQCYREALLSASDDRFGSDFAEFVGFAGSHIELKIADLEISAFFQDPGSDLEERHQELCLDHLEIDVVRLLVFEIINDGVFVAKQHHVFELVHTG